MTHCPALFEIVTAATVDSGICGANRRVLQALSWFADHGVDDPPQAWLARWSGLTPRRVIDSLKTLAQNEWIERHRIRNIDGRAGRTRYVVLADKLAKDRPPWADEIRLRSSALETSSAPPSAIGSVNAVQASHGPCANCSPCAASISHGSDAAYRERARVPARPSLSVLPAFAEYNWPSEEVRSNARQVLDLCGPGLADVANDPVKLAEMFDSLAIVLPGTWAQFDFRSIVLQVVARKTAKPRSKAKALRSFYLLTENMLEEQDKRSVREREARLRQASQGSGVRNVLSAKKVNADAPLTSINNQIEMVRRALARMERGEFGPFDLPNSERWAFHGSESERSAACERALIAEREKLAVIEAQLGSRAGNGRAASVDVVP